MKKMKISLAMIALMLGVAGSFAFAHPTLSKVDDPIYSWNIDGQQHTVAQAMALFNCSDGPRNCALGTLVSGSGPSSVQLKKP